MIPMPPPAYIAQVEMPALPPAIGLALQKRIGGIRGGVVIVARSNGQRARIDVFPNDGAPKIDENSRFEIGAIGEAITGTLLAEAARRGELQLDQPIDQIISPGLHVPPRGAHITLRTLATHRSGIPRIPLREAAQPYAGYDRSAMVAAVNGSALVADPGMRYAPSNVDFALLGMLLADRAGMPFDLLVRNRIFTPTAMKNSEAEGTGDEHLVPEYSISGDLVAPWHWNAFTPEGGIRSTALDLVRLTDELFAEENGPIAQDLRLAATPTADAGPDAGIGLGWLVDRRSGAVYASGYTYGTSAFIGAVPRWKEAVVILSNVGLGFANGSLDDLGLRLLAERSAYPPSSMTGQ
jgi:serine-type D-Ala-D-Ala carboxypeptidase/endopeptidase